MCGEVKSIQVEQVAFKVTVSGRAWQPFEALTAVDATLEFDAQAVDGPGPPILLLIHGQIERKGPKGVFRVPLHVGEIRDLLSSALLELAQLDRVAHAPYGENLRYRILDARGRLKDCPLPETTARLDAGGASDILERELCLGSKPWMQDWPIEVSDPTRLTEFRNYYDQQTDPLVLFDTMQLALASFEDAADDEVASRWFDRTLCRDFPLHGHTVAYWAALDREQDDPGLRSSDPEAVFAISRLLRDVWERSLLPIDVAWVVQR